MVTQMGNQENNANLTFGHKGVSLKETPLTDRHNGLTVIDVFCGCGGSSYGFKLAGFDIKAAIDKNSLATESYRLNFPDAAVLTKEIVHARAEKVAHNLLSKAKLVPGECTVLLGCAPCQGFCRLSKSGVDDPRNKLISALPKIIAVIRPEFCVIENVPGLVRGSGKGIFQQALDELKSAGYANVAWKVVNAADFGVPQRRKRLLLIASRLYAVSIPEASEKPRKTVRETISRLPPIAAGTSDPHDCLHYSPRASPKVMERIRNIPKDGGSRRSLPPELQLACHKRHSGFCDVYGRMKWDEPSPTITTGCINVTKGRFIHPEQDRAISVREAALFQTFPRDFEFCGTPWQIARQIGEAVPVELARKIADHIISLRSQPAVGVRRG
jgi:DNA (cytosine-5)-methyltransferase 1